MTFKRALASVVVLQAAMLSVSVLAQAPDRSRQNSGLTSQETCIVSGITAAALKGHVSFLASDALEGRGTPSKGLDEAGEYIASRFRDFGLEAAGDKGYFQTAAYESVTQSPEGVSLSLMAEGQPLVVSRDRISFLATDRLDLKQAGVVLLDLDTLPAATEARGKVLVVDLANVQSWTPEQRAARGRILDDPIAALGPLGGAALLFNRSKADNFGSVQLREASSASGKKAPLIISVNDADFRRLVAGWKPGSVPATIDLSVAAPAVVPVTLRNIAGVIRGADPALKDTYLIVSAHYDHLGIRPNGEGDRIFNGANDDASGVAAMLDIAHAIAGAGVKPKRTLLFLAFFGEEKSGLGSQWYAKHPIVPLAKTVADLNLEQLGRIDDADGPQAAKASITGFDYSEVSDFLVRSGAALGVTFFKHEKYSDRMFSKADNVFLARAGVPAHTVAITYEFPGRHTPGDEADKLDYANMELVTRAVGLAAWSLANSEQAPRWTSANPNAAPYAKAREKLTPAK